ncbi:hypothetical protein EOL70_01655 [Leucothrix sargassi]|nr:hypothetical protein EOL70_01655 [Leucothrix sargassi]
MQKPIGAGTVVSHRYQVQKKLQGNTFNSCYLAEDSENNNRLVTLSLPKIELLILPEFTPTFFEVCNKLMTSSFHGLLKIIGSGEHNSQPYAVLQYMSDETLEDELKRQRESESKASLESALDWAVPLSVTLDELHSRGYVHGSVKPQSVHVASQQVLLADFVTECTLQEIGKFKNGITTLDVDEYLSPEYLKSTYTPNYDQYLLATMIYESLAGKVPFARTKGGDDYRMQVATHVSPLLTAHRPELKAVSDVLAKAMKRKPDDRYKSCRAFISDLQEAQLVEPAKPPPQKRVVITTPFSDEPEEEQEAAMSPAQRRQRQKPKKKKGLIWLGVLFLAGGTAAYTYMNKPELLNLDTIKSLIAKTEKPAAEVTSATEPTGSVSTAPAAEAVDVVSTEPEQISATSSGASTAVESAVDEAELAAESTETALATESAEAPNVVQSEEAAIEATTEVAEPSEPAQVVDSVSSDNVPAVVQTTTDNTVQNEALFSELESAIDTALKAGEADFLSSSEAPESDVSTATTDVVPDQAAQDAALEQAITDALLNGRQAFQSDITQRAVTTVDALSVPVAEETSEAETSSAVQDGVATNSAELNSVEPVETSDTSEAESTVEAETTTVTEVVEPVEPEIEEVEQAPEDISTLADVVLADDTPSTNQAPEATTEEAGVVSTEAVAANTQAVDPRERLRLIKQQKIERIASVTQTCLGGGQIYREVVLGNLTFVKNCLSVGVNANIKQSNGFTLLHLAARSGHLNICKLLVAKGASTRARANNNKTPIDLAREARKELVVEYLQSR